MHAGKVPCAQSSMVKVYADRHTLKTPRCCDAVIRESKTCLRYISQRQPRLQGPRFFFSSCLCNEGILWENPPIHPPLLPIFRHMESANKDSEHISHGRKTQTTCIVKMRTITQI